MNYCSTISDMHVYISRFVDRIDEGKKFKMDPMQDMKRFLKETSKCKDDTKQKRKKKHKDIVGLFSYIPFP